MYNFKWLLLLLLHPALSQTTDKYSDEDRPYKFGFNIQGYQHRQEEKDEKGIIKGEYGFITADGYYRVTVYATDENGDFRIISMKNYYVGFPPEDPTTTPGPPSRSNGNIRPSLGSSFGTQPGSNRPQGPTGRALDVANKSRKPSVPERPQGLPACSDCSIPTTTVRTNNLIENSGDFRSGRKDGGTFGGGGTSTGGFGQGPSGGQVSQFPQGSPRQALQLPGGQNSQFPQGSPRANTQSRPGSQFSQGSPNNQQFPQEGPKANIQQSPGFNTDGRTSQGSTPFSGGNQNQGGPGFASGGRGNSGGGSGRSGFPRGPNDFEQNNQLDNAPRQRPRIGEVRDGLPPGVSVNDIKELLYTFNYTVGFHGHHEDGYRNGDKEGDYFFDGRDGVERKVEYIANEFGYQPNITFIDLPENDIRRPKEETEKEYGLKGYEFKWFYRK